MSVNTHTSDGDDAPAAMTDSLLLQGNGAFVQVPPLSRHAVGLEDPSNAQAVVVPVATSAVKSPLLLVFTDLTMRQCAAADGCGALAAAVATPAVLTAAVAAPSISPAATPRTLPDIFPPVCVHPSLMGHPSQRRLKGWFRTRSEVTVS